MRPRLLGVVTDLDGTLLRSDGSLSSLTRTIVTAARQRDVPFVIATARTPRAVRRIAGYEQLGVVVCANGAIVWDAGSDELVDENCFDVNELAAALDRLRRTLPEVGFALLSADTMFLDDAYIALRGKRSVGATAVRDFHDVLSTNRIAVVSLRHPKLMAEQMSEPVANAFGGVGLASFAGTSTVDVVPIGFNKVVAVERVLSETGCFLRDMVAFGDMPNDLEMFAGAGWSCAVANAHPSVLEAANETVLSNDEDGVARSVQEIFDL